MPARLRPRHLLDAVPGLSGRRRAGGAAVDPHGATTRPTHLAAGRALAPLRDEGVLIVGSGLSFHNLRQFGQGGALASHAFDAWLQHVLLELSPEERERALLQWSDAPYARHAHPREDHLVPLWVALGPAPFRRAPFSPAFPG
jgi:aromatic ring-opening dioxygenase catalytic subunit (LigB family)